MAKLSNEEIIEKIRKYQENRHVHPLTCGINSRHAILEPREMDGKVKLKCPACDYIQDWIPEFVLFG